jgi:hypothetical protein
MPGTDPTRGARLAIIEAKLDAIIEAISLLGQHGNLRLSAIEDAGSGRLGSIEEKLDRLLGLGGLDD